MRFSMASSTPSARALRGRTSRDVPRARLCVAAQRSLLDALANEPVEGPTAGFFERALAAASDVAARAGDTAVGCGGIHGRVCGEHSDRGVDGAMGAVTRCKKAHGDTRSKSTRCARRES